MGTQQLLLIVIGIVGVGLAIAAGIWLFSGNNISSNKDAILSDLENLKQYAARYKMLPSRLGGGGGNSYLGFTIPAKLAVNENATYSCAATARSIRFTAVSAAGYGTISRVLDLDGTMNTPSGNADF
jgi:hypothetical protein